MSNSDPSTAAVSSYRSGSEDLLLISSSGVARVLALNRPEKRNALNDALLVQLCDALREAQSDENVRTIVVTGQGTCFSSGRDQKDAGSAGSARAVLQDGTLQQTVGVFTDALRLLLESPKPTIASVRGMALAGGQALTLACDFVVAERGTRFGNPEMQFGFPAAMNTVLLARHIGRRKALEIALTGDFYSAEYYAELGLINRLVEPGSLQQETKSFADSLGALTPWAVRETKLLFNAVDNLGMAASLRAGDTLNQLLRANAQLVPVFDNPADTTNRLRNQLSSGGHRESN